MKDKLIKLVNELKYLALVFLFLVILFKAVFYKESITIVLKSAWGLFYMFLLPGFFIVYYWHDKLDFIERIIIGFPTSAVIIGVSSYYLGISGIHVKYHVIIPLILILAGLVITIIKKDGGNNEST